MFLQEKLKFIGFGKILILPSTVNQEIMSLPLTVNDAVAATIEIISAQTILVGFRVDDFGLSRKNQ